MRGLGFVNANLAQTQAKRVHPRQIHPRISLAHRPGDERLAIHQLDVEREARRALDQRLLDVVGIADMARQLVTRGYENLTLTGAPIDALKQPVLPRMSPSAALRRFLGCSTCATDIAQCCAKRTAPQALYYRSRCESLRYALSGKVIAREVDITHK